MPHSNAPHLNLAPICLFAFNRPEHTRKTVQSLLKNQESKNSILYAFCDGARNEEEKALVEEVRAYITSLQGFAQIHCRFRDENWGLAQSIIKGVSEVIQRHGKAIVVEDDLVTSPYFLQYLNENLDRYETDDRVISVHAYSYPTQVKLPETFFLKGADCWGWATWDRAWKLFNPNGTELLQQLKQKNLQRSFDFDGSYPYVKMLQDQVTGKNNSWAVRWYASAFLLGKLTLYPGRSLVTNIGLDGTGTHCADDDKFYTPAAQTPIVSSTIPVEENIFARKAFVSYFKSQRPHFLGRLARKVKRWLGP